MKYPKEIKRIINRNSANAQRLLKLDGWSTGYKYSAEKCFIAEDNQMPATVEKNVLFKKHTSYAYSLFLKDKGNIAFKNLPETVKKEASRWSIGICVYISTVLYHLMLKDQICRSQDLKYVQGYMIHCLPNSYEKGNLISHAWLEIRKSVVDLTVSQVIKYGFTLNGQSTIIGNTPEGLGMVGFYETKQTMEANTKKIAEASNMTVDEWIDFHHNNSNIYWLNSKLKVLI